MIRRLLRKFKWWHYERKHELPHPDEMRSYMPCESWTPRIAKIVKYYGLYGFSLEEISQLPEFNCTRERIRQLLMKARRQAHVARSSREAP